MVIQTFGFHPSSFSAYPDCLISPLKDKDWVSCVLFLNLRAYLKGEEIVERSTFYDVYGQTLVH